MTDLPTPSGKMTVTYEIDRKVKVPVWDEPAMRAFAAAAALAEREACAKVCAEYDDDRGTGETWGPRFAAMIRARSKE